LPCSKGFSPFYPKRNAKKYKKIQRNTKKHKEIQRNTKKHKETQRNTKKHKETQRNRQDACSTVVTSSEKITL
jgi:hypothetical protein